jgi:hypothetical protein
MYTIVAQRARLARMERACAETERHLAIVESQIAARAERQTITARVKKRQLGRSSSTWTPADERHFQDTLAAVRFTRRREIEALSRKHARQQAAIAAFRARRRSDAHSEDLIP